jgi:uncharacterized OsmC-like protein
MIDLMRRSQNVIRTSLPAPIMDRIVQKSTANNEARKERPMDPHLTDTIEQHGDPLAFRLRQGRGRSPLLGGGRDTIKVEARQLAGHQKEAVVTEGADGSAWRLTSDEGKHLRGTDLAPFPLGFFNAGMQSDLYGRMRTLAAARDIPLDNVEIRVANHYWLTGSFIHGTGEGHAEAPDIDVRVASSAATETIKTLVAAAMDASPAIAFLRTPLAGNTFALYINGRRRKVEGVANSASADAGDPYRVYAQAPRPLDPHAPRDLIEKTGQVEQGTVEPASATVTNKLIRNILGEGKSLGTDGMYETDTWLGMPGTSHFKLTSDEGGAGTAPCGLALLSAGIAFCYMTQLARYIENMKMNIHGVRLVQLNPYVAGARAAAEPIDTHLFLNGEAPEETHLQLLTIAARTCYLHAASKAPTEPKLRLVHNGRDIARAA